MRNEAQNKLNELMVFEGNSVKFIVEEGEPLFEIYSTGVALGQYRESKGYLYPNKKRIEQNLENAMVKPVVRNAQLYITESQLYDWMLIARTDKCILFRKWLTTEVLPMIRKTGGYVANEDIFIDTYLAHADDNTKSLFKLQLQTIRQLNNKIEEQLPLVEFAESVSKSVDTIDMKQLAKLVKDENINIGRNSLFEWLRKEKILMKNNEPYQRYMEQKWFEYIEYTFETPYGTKLGSKTLVTGRGQIAIVEKLKKAFGQK
jgi:phage antirepressor YoqD-like protein